MVWRETSVEDERREFVDLASRAGANISALCARFGISRQTGYVWLRRGADGETAFSDRSRRPHASPGRICAAVETRLCELRLAHPAWGARKLGALLRREGVEPPAASTIHAALLRNGLVQEDARRPQAYGRFERSEPNALWQMDFKGRGKLACGEFVHPLTVIDDHSRFAIGLSACVDQKTMTVRDRLTGAFRRYGLPAAIYVDNGSPWGAGTPGQWTRLRIWLLKLGVETIHGKPHHPQGRGKCERFHRTLDVEVFSMATLPDFDRAQKAFDRWRRVYNYERPHEALSFDTPSSRYVPSSRSFPERLPEPLYGDGEVLRKVPTTKQYIRFKGRWWIVPRAFAGETVAIRPRLSDGLFSVCFGAVEIATIDLKRPLDAPQKV